MHAIHFDPSCSLWLLQFWTGIGIGIGFGSSSIKVQRVPEKPPQNLASSRLGDRLHEYYLPNFLIRGHLHPPSSDQLAASAEENSGYCPTNRNAFSMHNKLVVQSYLTSSATWTWSRKKQQVLDASFSCNSSFLTAWIGLPGTAELFYFVQHRASFLNESWIQLISQQREGRSACQPGLLYDTNSGLKEWNVCQKTWPHISEYAFPPVQHVRTGGEHAQQSLIPTVLTTTNISIFLRMFVMFDWSNILMKLTVMRWQFQGKKQKKWRVASFYLLGHILHHLHTR